MFIVIIKCWKMAFIVTTIWRKHANELLLSSSLFSRSIRNVIVLFFNMNISDRWVLQKIKTIVRPNRVQRQWQILFPQNDTLVFVSQTSITNHNIILHSTMNFHNASSFAIYRLPFTTELERNKCKYLHMNFPGLRRLATCSPVAICYFFFPMHMPSHYYFILLQVALCRYTTMLSLEEHVIIILNDSSRFGWLHVRKYRKK